MPEGHFAEMRGKAAPESPRDGLQEQERRGEDDKDEQNRRSEDVEIEDNEEGDEESDDFQDFPPRRPGVDLSGFVAGPNHNAGGSPHPNIAPSPKESHKGSEYSTIVKPVVGVDDAKRVFREWARSLWFTPSQFDEVKYRMPKEPSFLFVPFHKFKVTTRVKYSAKIVSEPSNRFLTNSSIASLFQQANSQRNSVNQQPPQSSVFSSQLTAPACIWDDSLLESMAFAVTGCSPLSSSSPPSGASPPLLPFSIPLLFGTGSQQSATGQRPPEPLSASLSRLLAQFQDTVDLSGLATAQERNDVLLDMLELDSKPWYQTWKDHNLTETVHSRERKRVEHLIHQDIQQHHSGNGQRLHGLDFDCSILRIKHSLLFVPFYIFFFPLNGVPHVALVDAAQGSVFAERPFGLGALPSVISLLIRL